MNDLAAERLQNDPRIIEARRLVLAALAEHKQTLTDVRPPQKERATNYEQLVQDFADLRGGPLYFPYLGSGFGNGCLVELNDGSVKYDLISGIGVHGFGHSHPLLVSAGFDAAIQDTVMQGNLQQNVESADVSLLLLEAATREGSSRLAHVFLSTSGAMANENALKIAFQKHHPASRVLAFEHAFGGRTLALAQLTDKADYRQGLPTTLAVDYVPFLDPAEPKASGERAVRALRSHLDRYPGQHAVMCLELVQGEGGYNAGTREFFLPLLDLLKQHDITVWFDEVQTFGRSSSPFAFQTLGLGEYADVVTVGKMTQVCATLFTPALKPKPGLISQTFTGATSSLFAARAILNELLNGDYFGPTGQIAKLSNYFVSKLKDLASRRPGWVQGPFGFGTMIAFTPFDGSPEITKRLLIELYQAGVIGFIAGGRPARVRFLPPVGAARTEDIDAALEILESCMASIAPPSTT